VFVTGTPNFAIEYYKQVQMKFTLALPSTAYFVQNYKKMLANSALHHNLFIFARIRNNG